jgi:SAM-dependent methyltransferase
MPDTDNTAMARYWNEVAGPRWVQRQAIQEARNVEMLEQLLAAARPAPGEHVLDIGCGTGVTTEPYAKAVGPSGHVTAADISKPMLDAARQRIEAAGLGHVTLLLADAQTHVFPEASFDLLTSRLGVMFFADPTAAFRNLIKALRPGGRLCMAVWATLTESDHQRIPLEVAIRHLGPPAPQPPHAPGPNAYGDRDYLRGILAVAGFADITIEPRRFLVHGDTAPRAAEHSSQMGAVQRLMDEKNAKAATRAAIVRDIEAAFRPYESDGDTRIPATFLLATGQKP